MSGLPTNEHIARLERHIDDAEATDALRAAQHAATATAEREKIVNEFAAWLAAQLKEVPR